MSWHFGDHDYPFIIRNSFVTQKTRSSNYSIETVHKQITSVLKPLFIYGSCMLIWMAKGLDKTCISEVEFIVERWTEHAVDTTSAFGQYPQIQFKSVILALHISIFIWSNSTRTAEIQGFSGRLDTIPLNQSESLWCFWAHSLLLKLTLCLAYVYRTNIAMICGIRSHVRGIICPRCHLSEWRLCRVVYRLGRSGLGK